MKTRPYISLAVLFATTVFFMPARPTLAAGSAMKVVQSPNEITWVPAPATLPSGAQLAVISGDASKRGGTYALRLKVPDGYVFKPHWHPQNVNVTILSGGLGIGMGDKFDESKGQIVKTGGYILEPKEMHHYAWAQGPTIIEVYGEGPFGMNYVNSSDDPRNRAER